VKRGKGPPCRMLGKLFLIKNAGKWTRKTDDTEGDKLFLNPAGSCAVAIVEEGSRRELRGGGTGVKKRKKKTTGIGTSYGKQWELITNVKTTNGGFEWAGLGVGCTED